MTEDLEPFKQQLSDAIFDQLLKKPKAKPRFDNPLDAMKGFVGEARWDEMQRRVFDSLESEGIIERSSPDDPR